MKKVILNDKPNAFSNGQYIFSDSINTFDHINSDSTPIQYDKFSDKDLYTTVIDNELNKKILDGNLIYNKNSYININKLKIDNTGISGKTTRINTYVFLFTNEKFDLSTTSLDEYRANYADAVNILNEDGQNRSTFISNYSILYSRLFNEPTSELFTTLFPGEESQLSVDSRIYSSVGEERGEGQGLGIIINDANIITNLYSDSPEFVGDFTNSFSNYNPRGAFNTDEGSLLNLTGTQKIYIVVYTSGDKLIKYFPDQDRDNHIQVYEINSQEELEANKVQTLPFTDNDTLLDVRGGGDLRPAFKVSELNVIINTVEETGITSTYSPPEQYHDITGSITPPVEVELGDNFNNNMLTINPSSQVNSTIDYDYRPVSKCMINNSSIDLQKYYKNNNERLLASSPTQVNLDFYISSNDINVELFPINTTLGHLFYVLDWDDINNKYKNWDDVINDFPNDELQLLKKQQQNTYLFSDVGNGLLNNYNTPGIKSIKSVMLSYEQTGNLIEIVRWKFITTRIFLDIPVNQSPDFSELGGSDYVTIPWPFTTIIIGGVGEESKYKKSIRDTLSGGKIGNQDIIDENFLVQANENDELGQSIRKFDLEQSRYFDKPHGIYDLLNINAVIDNELIPFNDLYYDGETNKFPLESSVGQIFISDNQDNELKQSCKLELNTGELTNKSIYDSSGNSNKGLLIGDYKVKKSRKGEPMRRDSFIKVPKKTNNRRGAL